MEHKEIKMVVAALLIGGLLYFGMQYYRNQNHDNVKIQTTTESTNQQDKLQSMRDRLTKIEGKMANLPTDKQEKFKQIQEKIKARMAKMQVQPTPTA